MHIARGHVSVPGRFSRSRSVLVRYLQASGLFVCDFCARPERNVPLLPGLAQWVSQPDRSTVSDLSDLRLYGRGSHGDLTGMCDPRRPRYGQGSSGGGGGAGTRRLRKTNVLVTVKILGFPCFGSMEAHL